MNHILPQVEELISTLKQLMPTFYQQETLESIFGLFLEGQVKRPHHCTTKSESAISRFLNYWLILSLISYLLAYWVYLHLGSYENLDWYSCSEQALILLFPHIFILSLLKQLELLLPWLNERGCEFCFLRCKI
ncbi:MAG: hypothetical protein F6K14_03895 [Symploca sp. SIO2C1]|nr:hypothetical protein [Symploca sp. SIO2C1]